MAELDDNSASVKPASIFWKIWRSTLQGRGGCSWCCTTAFKTALRSEMINNNNNANDDNDKNLYFRGITSAPAGHRGVMSLMTNSGGV